ARTAGIESHAIPSFLARLRSVFVDRFDNETLAVPWPEQPAVTRASRKFGCAAKNLIGGSAATYPIMPADFVLHFLR
ncbi:MAG: hypothetical protein V7640_1831, partial [Betaproteobacteria bacterium]